MSTGRRSLFVTATRALRSRARDAAELITKGIVALRYDGPLGGAPGGPPLSLLYVGRERFARELEVYYRPDDDRRMGDARTNPPAVAFRGSLLDYARARARIEREAETVDLVAHEMFPGALSIDGVLHYPMLTASLPVAATIEQQIRRMRSRATRRLMRELARSDRYDVRIASGREAFETFRTTMYEPYVRARFGAWGHVDDPDSLRKLHEREGSILLVAPHSAPDEPFAGALLLDARDGVLGYHRNGFVGGCERDPRAAAERAAALELAMMRHAIAGRFTQIDFGYTRAVLNDGLLVHKRRLGCSFAPASYSPLFRLRVRPGCRAAVFARFPLLAGVPPAMSAVLGYDDGAPRLSKRAWRGVLKGFAVPVSSSAGSPPARLTGALVWTDARDPMGEAAFRQALEEALDLPDGVELRTDAAR
jgi:hypothetical protein